MFLDAVCRNDFKDAMMRADDHNKSALLAKDFAVVNMVYSISDTTGYMINERYYLKLRFNCGFIEVHPPASVTADIKLYRTINKFLKEWSI